MSFRGITLPHESLRLRRERLVCSYERGRLAMGVVGIRGGRGMAFSEPRPRRSAAATASEVSFHLQKSSDCYRLEPVSDTRICQAVRCVRSATFCTGRRRCERLLGVCEEPAQDRTP